MGTEIVMPALEMAQTTGTLIRWLKSEGELVRKGEPLMEVETDKVTVEVESSGTGILSAVTAHEGDVIPVGHVIAYLAADGETVPSRPDQVDTSSRASSLSAPTAAPALAIAASPLARRIAAEHNVDLGKVRSASGRIEKEDVLAHLKMADASVKATSVSGTAVGIAPDSGIVLASPSARRLASEHNIDLAILAGRGSGPEGAVLAENVLAAVSNRSNAPVGAGVQASAVGPELNAGFTVLPLTNVRKVIGDRLQMSYQTAPHISLTLSVDMSEALRAIERLRPAVQNETGHPLTITALLARAVGATLVKHPRLNAHLADGELRLWPTVHLGIAVALDDGLIVPVIRAIESRGMAAIQTELGDLSERARAGKLKPSEVKGSTFTVSNLGMYGIEQFNSILNPPEVGILSVGTIQDTPVGIGGQLVLRPMMRLTLSVDHRAVDGAIGAQFLKDLKATLEEPYRLLI